MPAPRMEAASFFEARKKDTADSLLGAQNIFLNAIIIGIKFIDDQFMFRD